LVSGSIGNVALGGGYAIPFPRTGTAPPAPSMVTQATSPITLSSPLIGKRRAATTPRAAIVNKRPIEDDEGEEDTESMTSNEGMLDRQQRIAVRRLKAQIGI
jgi:hypothetical protein